MPAVAGSMRRNSAGAVSRPRSRASAQPRTDQHDRRGRRAPAVSRPNSSSRSRVRRSTVARSAGRGQISSRSRAARRLSGCSVRRRARRLGCDDCGPRGRGIASGNTPLSALLQIITRRVVARRDPAPSSGSIALVAARARRATVVTASLVPRGSHGASQNSDCAAAASPAFRRPPAGRRCRRVLEPLGQPAARPRRAGAALDRPPLVGAQVRPGAYRRS